MKHELRHMRERGSGAIVDCSSQGGLVGTAGLGVYTAALEYAARSIRINAVRPGATDTPMVANALANEPETMESRDGRDPDGAAGQT